MSVKVLLVDAESIYREALSHVIQRQYPDFKVRQASDERGVCDVLEVFSPDVVLLETNIFNENDFGLIKTMKAANSRTKVVVWTNHDSTVLRKLIKQNGADHFFPKSTALPELFKLIEFFSVGQPSVQHH